MISSTADAGLDAKASSVHVTDEAICVEFVDGRTISVPTNWYPRLLHATATERRNCEINDFGIEWPDVEADFSIRGILLGHRSGENPACFRFWLNNRKRGKRVTVEQWLRQRSELRSARRTQDNGARRRSLARKKMVKHTS